MNERMDSMPICMLTLGGVKQEPPGGRSAPAKCVRSRECSAGLPLAVFVLE